MENHEIKHQFLIIVDLGIHMVQKPCFQLRSVDVYRSMLGILYVVVDILLPALHGNYYVLRALDLLLVRLLKTKLCLVKDIAGSVDLDHTDLLVPLIDIGISFLNVNLGKFSNLLHDFLVSS